MMDNGDDAAAADGDDGENVTRRYFRLGFSLLRQLSLLETQSIPPQNQFFVFCFSIVWKYVMRENMLYSMHEIYFSESREMVRILSVLHTYLDITSGDKINENLTC